MGLLLLAWFNVLLTNTDMDKTLVASLDIGDGFGNSMLHFKGRIITDQTTIKVHSCKILITLASFANMV